MLRELARRSRKSTEIYTCIAKFGLLGLLSIIVIRTQAIIEAEPIKLSHIFLIIIIFISIVCIQCIRRMNANRVLSKQLGDWIERSEPGALAAMNDPNTI
jgi:hypothetical protein